VTYTNGELGHDAAERTSSLWKTRCCNVYAKECKVNVFMQKCSVCL